jgi:hypothetical protein
MLRKFLFAKVVVLFDLTKFLNEKFVNIIH